MQFKTSLLELLRKEVACAEPLLHSLEDEISALSSMDEELIALSSAKKQELIEALQQASSTRMNLMLKHGFDSSPEAIEDFSASENSNEQLNKMFIQLSEIAQQCFSKNRFISQLINRRTHFISQALNSLSPYVTPQNLTYSKNGSTEKGNNSRSLYSI